MSVNCTKIRMLDKETALRISRQEESARALTKEDNSLIRTESSAHTAHHPDVAEAIRLDAATHPERTYSEHVAAAEEIAAEEYRREIRAMMKAGTLDPDSEDEL